MSNEIYGMNARWQRPASMPSRLACRAGPKFIYTRLFALQHSGSCDEVPQYGDEKHSTRARRTAKTRGRDDNSCANY